MRALETCAAQDLHHFVSKHLMLKPCHVHRSPGSHVASQESLKMAHRFALPQA